MKRRNKPWPGTTTTVTIPAMAVLSDGRLDWPEENGEARKIYTTIKTFTNHQKRHFDPKPRRRRINRTVGFYRVNDTEFLPALQNLSLGVLFAAIPPRMVIYMVVHTIYKALRPT